ncbi:hypothetical protein AUJ84_01565 [Candidatus Pacearchaeota archaeon CG1_02_32_132]|nr:MAG: hypothetical protein AUJ84_01565 [Candidatus Pacearchaeota archaeon CG1_02_32_132]
MVRDKKGSLTDYLKDVGSYSLLTREQEIELGTRSFYHGDRVARDTLVESNLGFVVHISKQYQGRGVNLADLVQGGNFGLIRAAENYDPNKGTRFTTYAIKWIKLGVRKVIADNGMNQIRTPTDVFILIPKVKKYLVQCEEMEVQPTREGLCEYVEMNRPVGNLERKPFSISEKKYNHLINFIGKYRLNVDRLFEADGNKNTFEDVRVRDPVDIAGKNEALEILEKILHGQFRSKYHVLTDIEIAVLEQRFAEDVMTYDEIGRDLGLTKERVRQIEIQARERIKSFLEHSSGRVYN